MKSLYFSSVDFGFLSRWKIVYKWERLIYYHISFSKKQIVIRWSGPWPWQRKGGSVKQEEFSICLSVKLLFRKKTADSGRKFKLTVSFLI